MGELCIFNKRFQQIYAQRPGLEVSDSLDTIPDEKNPYHIHFYLFMSPECPVTHVIRFIRLRRKPRIYAGRNALVIRFGGCRP
jgi:hypothetical protein